MKFAALTAIALCALDLNAAAAAGDPGPERGWMLKPAVESCYLSRDFGGTQVLIQAFGPNSPYHVLLLGDGVPVRDHRAEEMSVEFGERQESVLGVIGKAGKIPAAIFMAAPPRRLNLTGWAYFGKPTDIKSLLEIDPSAETLTITFRDTGASSFRLGPMREEFAKLDACIDAKVKDWGNDIQQGDAPVEPPALQHEKEQAWHTKYPEDLLLNRISGFAEVRMTVGKDGRARDCVVQVSALTGRFGAKTCDAFTSVARFEPAKDADGNPVPALYQTGVSFFIYQW